MAFVSKHPFTFRLTSKQEVSDIAINTRNEEKQHVSSSEVKTEQGRSALRSTTTIHSTQKGVLDKLLSDSVFVLRAERRQAISSTSIQTRRETQTPVQRPIPTDRKEADYVQATDIELRNTNRERISEKSIGTRSTDRELPYISSAAFSLTRPERDYVQRDIETSAQETGDHISGQQISTSLEEKTGQISGRIPTSTKEKEGQVSNRIPTSTKEKEGQVSGRIPTASQERTGHISEKSISTSTEEKTGQVSGRIPTASQERTGHISEKSISTSTEEKTGQVSGRIPTASQERTGHISEKSISTSTEEKTGQVSGRIPIASQERTGHISEKSISTSTEERTGHVSASPIETTSEERTGHVSEKPIETTSEERTGHVREQILTTAQDRTGHVSGNIIATEGKSLFTLSDFASGSTAERLRNRTIRSLSTAFNSFISPKLFVFQRPTSFRDFLSTQLESRVTRKIKRLNSNLTSRVEGVKSLFGVSSGSDDARVNPSGIREDHIFRIRNANVTSPDEDEGEGGWYKFPYGPEVSVSRRNNIIRNQPARSFVNLGERRTGSVKERWSTGDYEINIQGTMISTDPNYDLPSKPDRFINLLTKYEEYGYVDVQCTILTMYGITGMVIDHVSFPNTPSDDAQEYTIRAYSDVNNFEYFKDSVESGAVVGAGTSDAFSGAQPSATPFAAAG